VLVIDKISHYYLEIKSLHIIFMTFWMAGMFYLPRIYVYHLKTQYEKNDTKFFELMEKRLIKVIMNPSMFLTISLGTLLAVIPGTVNWSDRWIFIKIFLVLIMILVHILFVMHYRELKSGQNKKSVLYFKIINEIPPLLLVVIVLLVVLKPY